METNRMELSMDELETVNGGTPQSRRPSPLRA